MEWLVLSAVLLSFGVALLLAGGGRRTADQQARRLAAIERKTDLIIDHLGIRPPGPEAPGPVLQELRAGRKIQAVKAYREATGVGLKEAKDAVDLVAREHGLP